MGILAKLLLAIFLVIAVILSCLGMVFISLLVEYKILMRRRKILKENLTREEARLIELTALVNQFTSQISVHIGLLIEQHKALLNKKEHCTCSPTNKNDIKATK